MIEPTFDPSAEEPESGTPPPDADPVVLEDLAAVLRLPRLFRKLDRVLERVLASFSPPQALPFARHGDQPGDGVSEYGLKWRDAAGRLQLFVGMSWGEDGQDPAWEVRLDALSRRDAALLRRSGVHRYAARRAESRFSDWDRFWWENSPETARLLGASAAGSRFLEENDPDAMAAEYLAGALYALHASGSLALLANAVQELPEDD